MMATKAANPRRTTKRPKLCAVACAGPRAREAAATYETIAARMGYDATTLHTTAWTPERERILETLFGQLERIPTDILIAWLPAFDEFVIDGEWHIDPECTKWSPNIFGTLNSVIAVN